MNSKIRLLIADDNPLTRDGMKRLLRYEAGIQIVGEVSVVSDLIKFISRSNPDIVLLDIKWGHSELAGLKLLQMIKNSRYPVKVILHTAHPKLLDNDNRVALADGIILNSMSAETLINEIRRVMRSTNKATRTNNSPLVKIVFFGFLMLAIVTILGLLIYYIGSAPLQSVVYLSIAIFLVVMVSFLVYVKRINAQDFIELVKKLLSKIVS